MEFLNCPCHILFLFFELVSNRVSQSRSIMRAQKHSFLSLNGPVLITIFPAHFISRLSITFNFQKSATNPGIGPRRSICVIVDSSSVCPCLLFCNEKHAVQCFCLKSLSSLSHCRDLDPSYL